MTQSESQSFEEVKGRLDEIVEAVSDENIALDDALALYEEAVKLGLQASALLEENLEANNARYDEERSDDREDEDVAGRVAEEAAPADQEDLAADDQALSQEEADSPNETL